MKTGLFLTPGAAMTAYEVGVVHALVQEGGIQFDVIAGSSAGAFNGAFTATGQIEQLVQLWSGWHSKDVLSTDWIGLLRGAVLWSPALMQEDRYMSYVDKYINEERLLPGVRFRFNLANLNTGSQEFFEWPGGAPFSLSDGVKAAVSVPAVIKPREIQGTQWVDGFTVDGFPLEQLALETDIERVFVLGVAPQTLEDRLYPNMYQMIMRAMKLNQFSETYVGIEQAQQINTFIEQWETDRKAIEQIIEALVEDASTQAELLTEVEQAYMEANFPYKRAVIEIVPILPEHEIDMFFSDYQPERSKKLLEQGRKDALRILANLKK